MNRFVLLLACVTLGAGIMPALAQPPAPNAPLQVMPIDLDGPGLAGPGNPRAREVLEKVLIARLSEDLALDDAQTVLLVRRYTQVREKLVELRQQRQEKMRELREALSANQENDRLTALLEELQAVDQQMEETRQSAFETMSVGLTPWQKARLYIFFSEFENQLRRLLSEVRRERAGQRGPGDGRGPQRPEKAAKPEQ